MRHPCVYVIIETEKDTNCKCVYDVKTYILRCVELYVNFVKSSALNEYASSLVFFWFKKKKLDSIDENFTRKSLVNSNKMCSFVEFLQFYWIFTELSFGKYSQRSYVSIWISKSFSIVELRLVLVLKWLFLFKAFVKYWVVLSMILSRRLNVCHKSQTHLYIW